ncbi:uncharacterized protein LOC129602395 [Paramacrobiotus metropolitanus]|uniref:uncharacterized protein LOC129602395 n=1 Tax=Paramacrobiotus metropolitanus TaxID=2943436 RepID=UPI002445617E|nr:uncharacterized protein LOC129602395 [Paramacrobiotus metropolitanus]XP_055357376.1 uncharacterized protein LOC129602395 [Paramacrobiotus metropolitanus]
MFAILKNQINVVGDNNFLLYGRVVDVADDALGIDLLCAGRRRERIPFQQLLCRPAQNLACLFFLGIYHWESVAVEVLLRRDGTWRWWSSDKRIRPLPAGWRGASAEQLQRMKEVHLALVDGDGSQDTDAQGQVVCFDVADGQVQYVVDLYGGGGLGQSQDTAQKIVDELHSALTQRLPVILCEMTARLEGGTPDAAGALGVDV